MLKVFEKYLWSISTFSTVADSRSATAAKISTDIFQRFCGEKKQLKKWTDLILQEQLFSQEHLPTSVHLKSIGNT